MQNFNGLASRIYLKTVFVISSLLKATKNTGVLICTISLPFIFFNYANCNRLLFGSLIRVQTPKLEN